MRNVLENNSDSFPKNFYRWDLWGTEKVYFLVSSSKRKCKMKKNNRKRKKKRKKWGISCATNTWEN